jgi:phosphatidylglycerophosphatase A
VLMNTAEISNLSSQRTSWAWIVATFFGSGLLRPGPGSWASAFTALIWYFSVRNSSASLAHIVAISGAIVSTLIGIPAATIVARESQNKDPGFVVIDEVAGQLLPLMLAPASWKYLFASFILFRCFDIFKPPPVRQLEALPEGTGIVLDDVGAGLYALLVLFLLLHFKLL